MSVFLAKGDRLLNEDGEWLCPKGHDKSVVGVTPRGNCRICKQNWTQEVRWNRGRQREDYNGDRQYMPNLREIRLQLGMTLDHLALTTGVGKSTLSRIERCEHRAGYSTRQRILKVLIPGIQAQRRHGYR